mmetsp:Transcript_95950/g.267997  ORF Transcript_95950/g.267997 Transcript_95950/m.267997 type:complete len:273 (+) Transcript_95950:64-882(+)
MVVSAQSFLEAAADKHGESTVCMVLEALSKARAIHIEQAPHGCFIKMHFAKSRDHNAKWSSSQGLQVSREQFLGCWRVSHDALCQNSGSDKHIRSLPSGSLVGSSYGKHIRDLCSSSPERVGKHSSGTHRSDMSDPDGIHEHLTQCDKPTSPAQAEGITHTGQDDPEYQVHVTTSDYRVIGELETQGTWEKVVGPVVGDVLEVCKEFTSDDASCRVVLKPEVRGKIEEIDDNGDMKVFFPSLVKNNLPRWFGTCWVCQHHFGYLKKRAKPET